MAEHKTKYWLLKSEPTSYSFDDLKRDKSTAWTGVRNYQARNYLRDEMKAGDGALFYHSSTDPMAIVGICEITSNGFPDETAFDPKDHHYDPKSLAAKPTWYAVEVRYVRALDPPMTLADVKKTKGLEKMVLVQKGSRLSIQPVTESEWKIITKK